nr:MAG TPA: hypothetical protein [Caudoviricetes sp.]
MGISPTGSALSINLIFNSMPFSFSPQTASFHKPIITTYYIHWYNCHPQMLVG